MSINTDHSLLGVDISSLNSIPEDVLSIIFKFENLSLETDILALVCKTWKECVDSEDFRESIRPSRVMGIKQLIKQNPNIIFEGKEHPLPRKFYKEYVTRGGLCFFNPGRVKLKIVHGIYKSVVLNSLEAIASLFPNVNLQTNVPSKKWGNTRKEMGKEEAPHWVWEESEVIGFNKTYAEQQEIAKEQDKALYPDRYPSIEENSGDESKASKPKQIVVMSDGEDHVLGKCMAESILGEREVTWDIKSNKFVRVRIKHTIKFGDGEWLVAVAVEPSRLYVSMELSIANRFIGFVCARKSFGTANR